MKKHCLIPVALLFLSISTIAQVQNHPPASDALFLKGLYYSYGGLLLKNIDKAKDFFSQSATLGNKGAMFYLGKIYTSEKGYTNPDSALYWYNRAANDGYTDAWMELGNLYHFALLGIPQDFAKAYLFYEKGAAAEDVKCITMLGYYNFKGLNNKQNYGQALAYFTKAANMGSPMAEYYIGLQYKNGYGVKRDLDSADIFLKEAAKYHEVQAIKELAITFSENPVEKIIPPIDLGQKNNNGYKRIKHNVSSGSIKGSYKGYAIRYDWSGINIISIFPLEATFNTEGNKITGIWVEGKDTATIKAFFTDSALIFANTQYKKIDHYSEFKGGEIWQFNKAKFSLIQQPDSLFISGNVQLYSNSRNEPGKPLYIHLARAITNAEQLAMDKTATSLTCNNPFNNTLMITFKISKTTAVTIQLQTLEGQPILVENAGTLLAGTYTRSLPIPRIMASGSYILQLQTDAGNKVKIIVKQ